MLPCIERIILIVLDGVGAGELPDADTYGDAGSNTLAHVCAACRPQLPNLGALGLGNVLPLAGVPPTAAPRASYGRLAERSAGKDSTVGHWELMGVVSSQPYPVYPEGFPQDMMDLFEARTGRGVLGNRPASGTEIIKQLDAEHRKTGKWIVYTSADSVFQVAAHEEVAPTSELYRACEVATELFMNTGRVLRVIARPYAGPEGKLHRTTGRRDYNRAAPDTTVLDILAAANRPVTTVGKVDRLFAGRGVTVTVHTGNNTDTLSALVDQVELGGSGLVFANLIDFDMLYGHRNDVVGFAKGLEEFDATLPGLLRGLHRDDVLMITADHGCDPTTPSTDHSREYVPLLVCGPHVRAGVDLRIRNSFADVGATICRALGVQTPYRGASFWCDVADCDQTGDERVARQRVDWLRRRDIAG